uniref:Uncharacterized protein n=1 Tax=Lutzomyia longipalpis TaxID=7200 RepID=A0A1B0CWR2_LUTLO
MSSEPKVKNADPKRPLKAAEVDFMKLIEQQNLERVLKLKRTRKNNLITALRSVALFCHLRIFNAGSEAGKVPG